MNGAAKWDEHQKRVFSNCGNRMLNIIKQNRLFGEVEVMDF